MLETIDLQKKVDKPTYKARMADLSERLYFVQQRAWEAGVPVIILFEGWDAAGKGTTIHELTDPIDPRGYKIYPIRASRTYEKKRPWLWRFWNKIPARGEWAIFDRSWYGRVLVERMLKLVPEKDVERYYRDIVDFERTLADDGVLVLKFFLHISKKEQGKRFKKLQKDRLEAWRVTDEDLRNHKRYKKWLRFYEEMLASTNTEWGEWTVVEATDRRNTYIRVYETVVEALEERLRQIDERKALKAADVQKKAPAAAAVPAAAVAADEAEEEPEEQPVPKDVEESGAAVPVQKEPPMTIPHTGLPDGPRDAARENGRETAAQRDEEARDA